jgi:quinol monooxygenase YgiN
LLAADPDPGGSLVIVLRFKVQCQPDKTEQASAAFRAVIAPSRELEGVISFDIARDLADPNAIIAVEVFQDEAARERQESLPEVATVLGLLPDTVASPPEATVFQVSSAAPAM